MRRWVGLVGALASCGGRPERPDASEFDGAIRDSASAPVPNDCDTRTFPFEAALGGYIEGTVRGFGVYEYEAVPLRRTSVYLQACPRRTSIMMALHYYGIARIEPGTYNITRIATEAGGFTFSYTDNLSGTGVTCADSPTGTVTIDTVDFDHIEGSFSATARCFSEPVLGRIPPDATFTGTFTADNIGLE